MERRAPAKLVVFDYSGTLSPEAPRFGRPENLVPALRESGLAALGVEAPERFWRLIVDPTWDEGSTTAIGYRQLIAGRIAALGLAGGAPAADVAAAAARFVDLYLARSPIDARWRPLLERLSRQARAAAVIATDHYAEATDAIIGRLGAWHIPAGRLPGEADPLADPGDGRPAPVLVANSADIGFWKADRRFWEVLKVRTAWTEIASILVVDDFGFNEASADRYSAPSKVIARREQTRDVLTTVFQVPVELLPFFLEADAGHREAALGRLIAETAGRVDLFLGAR